MAHAVSRPTIFTPDKEKLHLFKWVNERGMSVEWAHGFLKQKDKYAPKLLKEKIKETFLKEALFFLNFHQNILQFPYVLRWGIRGSAGITRNYSVKSTYFIPLQLSLILQLQIFEHQVLIPFTEIGVSSWNIDFEEFTQVFPFWSIGTRISLSLFKRSLQYTFPNEYGIGDVGLIFELRNNISPPDYPDEEKGYFLRTFHAGVYFKF